MRHNMYLNFTAAGRFKRSLRHQGKETDSPHRPRRMDDVDDTYPHRPPRSSAASSAIPPTFSRDDEDDEDAREVRQLPVFLLEGSTPKLECRVDSGSHQAPGERTLKAKIPSRFLT